MATNGAAAAVTMDGVSGRFGFGQKLNGVSDGRTVRAILSMKIIIPELSRATGSAMMGDVAMGGCFI
jgi:hypothetical protein